MAASRSLDSQLVQEVIQTWYSATNDHLPVEQVEMLLSPGVEMRYPNRDAPFIGRAAFREWYADVLSRFFDETHIVESWDIDVQEAEATAVVVVRWETRSWEKGAARSRYDAYLSRQRFRLVRCEDGVVRIASKIAETFETTAPLHL
jgi:hypothetical protein